MKIPKISFQTIIRLATVVYVLSVTMSSCTMISADKLKEDFKDPPNAARPGVYWYFMDGNLSREGMTADLESMKRVGIGHVLFLEVNVGVPRGKVDFLSEEWLELLQHAIHETERLGIEFTLGSGPGWAGSGGPWVNPEQSMQHLVASSTEVKGPSKFNEKLAIPEPRKPYFGEGALTESLKKKWAAFYEDTFVLAFPTPEKKTKIEDVDEKALYYRAPYTSRKGVKPFLPAPAKFDEVPDAAIDTAEIIDITDKLQADGKLEWNVPEGNWTIMRFGKRNNGAVTRPAPMPGLGFEADKFDTIAFNAHFDEYIGEILQKVGPQKKSTGGGWTMIHIDSWEMGAQNWTDNFREEFKKRRAYDPLKFFPTYTGKVVGSLELSERFLWDIRQTSMELVIENHAEHFKELGRRHGFTLSIEPYDMNPSSDLDLGAVADVPMCEFWTKGLGFNSSFSCIESTSIAHVFGQPVVAAEAFTAGSKEGWKMYPGNVKNQGDWAFCIGINKFVYHTFAHKPLGDQYRPGMNMGPYGVHWDRGQTWWSLSSAYHRYITRCQHMLRQGRIVSDILYVTPEGAPHVFRPPLSALEGDEVLPDKRGYSFDGCSPLALIEMADVKNHQIVFPGGATYRLLVLPDFETMTPELMGKVEYLVQNGAVILGGTPPLKSPSLSDFPECDQQVRASAEKVWGGLIAPEKATVRNYGNGTIYWGGHFSETDTAGLYPVYEVAANLLKDMGVGEDFSASGSIRYTHRTTTEKEIYFISNRTSLPVQDICTFRNGAGTPELWDPVTGETRLLTEYTHENGQTSIPMKLDKDQSFFIVFSKNGKIDDGQISGQKNFPELNNKKELAGSWNLSFDSSWGGPENITFDELEDWSKREEEGIKYYSGIATYHKTFDMPETISSKNQDIYLDLGEVKNLARVRLNGKDLGVIWTTPARVKISKAVQAKGNELEIEVANLWGNRLIGDEELPFDDVRNGKWPEWLLEGKPRTSGRYTFTTYNYYKKDMPLQPSGLLGPVTIYSILKTNRHE